MTKRHQRVFERKHNDLYESSAFTAEFYNYTKGQYDPNTGEMTLQTRDSSPFATVQVEIVPPAMDTTVDTEGTSFSWDTSIRVPEDSAVVGSLVPYGEDSERPTEIEITDPETSTKDVYELQGYQYEKGSGFIMCRVVEQ